MQLKDCFIGMIVKERETDEIGHIVDLTLNGTDAVILVVKWISKKNLSDNSHYVSIHPANVEKL
jgi:hypothetical protein